MNEYSPYQYPTAYDDLRYLDIRSWQEHQERSIPGSLYLNYYELNYQRARQVLGQPDGRQILVYCRSGAHSGPAAQRLRQYGYNAQDMGSLSDWEGPLVGYLV